MCKVLRQHVGRACKKLTCKPSKVDCPMTDAWGLSWTKVAGKVHHSIEKTQETQLHFHVVSNKWVDKRGACLLLIRSASPCHGAHLNQSPSQSHTRMDHQQMDMVMVEELAIVARSLRHQTLNHTQCYLARSQLRHSWLGSGPANWRYVLGADASNFSTHLIAYLR